MAGRVSVLLPVEGVVKKNRALLLFNRFCPQLATDCTWTRYCVFGWRSSISTSSFTLNEMHNLKGFKLFGMLSLLTERAFPDWYISALSVLGHVSIETLLHSYKNGISLKHELFAGYKGNPQEVQRLIHKRHLSGQANNKNSHCNKFNLLLSQVPFFIQTFTILVAASVDLPESLLLLNLVSVLPKDLWLYLWILIQLSTWTCFL